MRLLYFSSTVKGNLACLISCFIRAEYLVTESIQAKAEVLCGGCCARLECKLRHLSRPVQPNIPTGYPWRVVHCITKSSLDGTDVPLLSKRLNGHRQSSPGSSSPFLPTWHILQEMASAGDYRCQRHLQTTNLSHAMGQIGSLLHDSVSQDEKKDWKCTSLPGLWWGQWITEQQHSPALSLLCLECLPRGGSAKNTIWMTK